MSQPKNLLAENIVFLLNKAVTPSYLTGTSPITVIVNGVNGVSDEIFVNGCV